MLFEVLLTFLLVCIQHLEEERELRSEVGAVFARRVFDKILERTLRFKECSIFSKKAEEDTHKQHFKRMAVITGGAQTVMEPAHAFGGLDVDRVLRLYALGGIASYEAEKLDMPVKVFEFKFCRSIGFKVIEPDTREIGYYDIARKITFGEAVKIFQRLFICRVEIKAKGLMLGD